MGFLPDLICIRLLVPWWCGLDFAFLALCPPQTQDFRLRCLIPGLDSDMAA